MISSIARLPIRFRVTACFAVLMALLLVALGGAARLWMGRDLLDEIDTGLRFRAAAVLQAPGDALPVTGSRVRTDPRLQELTEAFGEVLGRDGRLLRASAGVSAPALSQADLSRVVGPTFFTRHVRGMQGTSRLLAVPSGADVLVVGATLADREDALRRLNQVFMVGGPVAVAIAWLGSWLVAGWALRTVDRMRAQAAAITASGSDRRLTVPPARDELQALAVTLNEMLERLDTAIRTERAFVETASHELRTPLAALRAEVDLSLVRPRSPEELRTALLSVSEEIDRLSRLANDLLVLARATDGRLPLHRERASLREVLTSVAELFAARAENDGVTIAVDAPDVAVRIDPLRIRQALVNLVDNALRHTSRNGRIQLRGRTEHDEVRIEVGDSGSGFADLTAASEGAGPGLGLRVVRAIAASHRGSVTLHNDDGGSVTLTLAQ